MKYGFAIVLFVFLACACRTDQNKETSSEKDSTQLFSDTIRDTLPSKLPNTASNDTIKVPEVFSNHGFDSTIYYDLLIETHLCNPNYSDTTSDGTCPCSARYFRFFSYNHHRRIQDAFLLQVRAGVNGYPYRRLLIFVREQGKLVLMNGVVGYLYKKIPQPSGFDDLIVGVIDDLGNNNFSRYDVLLRYKDGKYRFVKALGDLEGKFDNEQLIKRASKAIKKRIDEKHLIF